MLATLWVTMGGATIFLLIAAIKSKGTHRCKGVEINIHGVSNNFFVDKKDILNSITAMEKINPVGKNIGSFNLKKLENELKKDVWIKSAELFFDNNEILQVTVQEREPIARVFTLTGNSFYIDIELSILPLSEKFSARLPVFSNFPSDKKLFAKADSNLLIGIKKISLAIQNDTFCMAMIEQIDITTQYSFEMIPKIGNQLIVFGDATDVETKLNKLKMFYKEVMTKSGWNTYRVINVQYQNQVVAKRKGAEDVIADSLRAFQIMQLLAERAQKLANDSIQMIQQDNDRNTVHSNMILQSIQRDENNDLSGTDEISNEPKKIIQQKQDIIKKEVKSISNPVQKLVSEKNKIK